jgi:FtsZ-binding cell division protein ZapB
MNAEVTAKMIEKVSKSVVLSVEEFNLIQVALWTLKEKVNSEMAKSNSQNDRNELYVYAQQIIDLKYDLKEVFDKDF